jgi:hypothetical protein
VPPIGAAIVSVLVGRRIVGGIYASIDAHDEDVDALDRIGEKWSIGESNDQATGAV